MTEKTQTILSIKGITKSFGTLKVLKGVSLDIKAGEFVTLLGPSGCGKTTLLRIIAGLESPDKGKIILDGEDMTGVVPNRRPVNTVFQSYALFEHMTVGDNIGYALKLRGVPRAERQHEVRRMLSLVRLEGVEDKMPQTLSGGQRQRVAIARAVIGTPKVLLLDEPLGALDLALRREMQIELKKLQSSLGITFVYITHDQEEALNMSDRIAVMRDGEFVQIGSPSEIYSTPESSYVARFVGEANILSGMVCEAEGEYLKVAFGTAILPVRLGAADMPSVGDRIEVSVRREDVLTDESGIEAVVTDVHFSGGVTRLITDVPSAGQVIAVQRGLSGSVKPRDTVRLRWSEGTAVALPTGKDVK